MKLRHLLTGAILGISLAAAAALTSFAAVSKGRFETVNSTAISGWAYNSSSPDDALNVRISITDKNSGQEVFSQKLTAGEYRDELYKSHKGNGCHGFTINIDWSSYPEGTYQVDGYVGDSSFSNPRTYTNGNPPAQTQAEVSETEETPGLVPLGVFKTTGYCPCRACSEGWGRHTCTGAVAAAGHTIAVDPRVIPYGSKVMINGVVYTAEDRGGAVKGNHIDIFFNTHAETRQHGTRNAQVYLVQS